MANLFLLDQGADVFSKKEKNLYFLLLLFFFAMYMPVITWLYNVCMWLIFVYCFVYSTPSDRWRVIKMRPAVCIMILFFLLNCVSALLSENLKEGISWAGIRISLLIFPLSIGSIIINYPLKQRIVLGFIVATCFAAIICLGYGMVRAAVNHDGSLLYNDNLSQVVNLQSVYFAMLINITLLGFGYLKIKRSPFVRGGGWWLVLLLLLTVHFLLASRIAILTLYTGVFIFAACIIFKTKTTVQGTMLFTGFLLLVFLFFSIFPKTLNRFKEIGYTHFDYGSIAKESHFNMVLTPDQWNGTNIRIAVWQCAWQVTKKHLLFGTGLGNKMDRLTEQYAVKGFVFGIKTNRNVHNNYLDVWMSLGLLGLLIFLAGFFVLPAIACVTYRDWYGLLVLACLFIALFTETYMDRTMGNTILSFFVSFIACYKKREQPAGSY